MNGSPMHWDLKIQRPLEIQYPLILADTALYILLWQDLLHQSETAGYDRSKKKIDWRLCETLPSTQLSVCFTIRAEKIEAEKILEQVSTKYSCKVSEFLKII